MNGCSTHGTKMKNMFVKEKQWWMGQNKMDKEQKGPGKDIRAECCINKERDSPDCSSGWEDSYRRSDERSVTALIDNSTRINNIFRLGSKYPSFFGTKMSQCHRGHMAVSNNRSSGRGNYRNTVTRQYRDTARL